VEDILRPEEVKKLGGLVKGLLPKVLAGVAAKDLCGKRKEYFIDPSLALFLSDKYKGHAGAGRYLAAT